MKTSRPSKSFRSKEGGFTLIETLIGVTIMILIVLGIAGIMQTMFKQMKILDAKMSLNSILTIVGQGTIDPVKCLASLDPTARTFNLVQAQDPLAGLPLKMIFDDGSSAIKVASNDEVLNFDLFIVGLWFRVDPTETGTPNPTNPGWTDYEGKLLIKSRPKMYSTVLKERMMELKERPTGLFYLTVDNGTNQIIGCSGSPIGLAGATTTPTPAPTPPPPPSAAGCITCIQCSHHDEEGGNMWRDATEQCAAVNGGPSPWSEIEGTGDEETGGIRCRVRVQCS